VTGAEFERDRQAFPALQSQTARRIEQTVAHANRWTASCVADVSYRQVRRSQRNTAATLGLEEVSPFTFIVLTAGHSRHKDLCVANPSLLNAVLADTNLGGANYCLIFCIDGPYIKYPYSESAYTSRVTRAVFVVLHRMLALANSSGDRLLRLFLGHR
jgi:hypothetical protein